MSNQTTSVAIDESPGKASRLSIFWGLALLVCGLLAISLPLAASASLAFTLAGLLLLAGVAHVIFALQPRSIGGALGQGLLALICGLAGIYMLINPFLGLLSLTPVLATILFLQGAFEVEFYYESRQLQSAKSILFTGILTMLLGALIWAQWPSSSFWVLGTLLGISLIFSGVSRFLLSFATRNATAK